ncbi:hypothetical protein BAE44_0000313 [Dichanthelium oligosanthes]|uniref:Uncharacterized protein n=1 Tax=Dichanthelium oligosanthes TaxID=888268 RepID=A0A1E5WMQ3_9POAL|nr:hypothetical protein BAE44_0000313 [Dichanthelium oligosanthes]
MTDSLQKRWSIIPKDTSRFCGFKAELDRKKQSGKTEKDWALVGKSFQFMHCWHILRHQKKWQYWVQGKSDEPLLMGVGGSASNDNIGNVANPESGQPIGRDSAKKQRSSEQVTSSDSSACLEVLQK